MSRPVAPGARSTRFHKYSCYGNHFVLVDEIEQTGLSEPDKRSFARRAADRYAGVGADGVLFVQPFTPRVLMDIQRECGYWDTADHVPGAEPAFVVRFFEPDGTEFLTCGSGLACLALHLHRVHGIAAAEALVEVPSRQPSRSAVAFRAQTRQSDVRLRTDRGRVADFVGGAFAQCRWGDAFVHAGIALAPGEPATASSSLVVYTGEPHLVVFQTADGSRPPRWPAFSDWRAAGPDFLAGERPLGPSRLLHAAGCHLNGDLADCFPHGVNVSVARPLADHGAIESRTFERGLCRETFACGTGALAIGMAARLVGIVEGDPVRILPRRARSHPRYRHAEIVVDDALGSAPRLTSQAEHVFSGTIEVDGETGLA
jgi:diaminopimelate epimerase